jgi:isocitrate dehydrogenase
MQRGADITVAFGDGIGPEIMSAVLHILQESGALITSHVVDLGEAAFRQGHRSGISPAAWESFRHTRILLKAPTTTRYQDGPPSAAVTLRKTLDLYANVRPCIAYAPLVPAPNPRVNLVVIHENEEDLFAGIEHQQIHGIAHCLKLITRQGSEKAIRYALEYAYRAGKNKIACFTKANILRLSDGTFRRVFDEVGADYPEIERFHYTVDTGFAKLAVSPDHFEVVVVPSVYGDILSEIAAQLAGSVGMGPSIAIGDSFAMFEAIHGSAPKHEGRDVANPSGLLLSAIAMLDYMDQSAAAERVYNAWLTTLEDGIRTYDICNAEGTQPPVGTKQFARAVVERLGREPKNRGLPNRFLALKANPSIPVTSLADKAKQLVGVDVFVDWDDPNCARLIEILKCSQEPDLRLDAIFNRGTQVWPDGFAETCCVNHWCCRFRRLDLRSITQSHIATLFQRLNQAGINITRTEALYDFQSGPGYFLR